MNLIELVKSVATHAEAREVMNLTQLISLKYPPAILQSPLALWPLQRAGGQWSSIDRGSRT